MQRVIVLAALGIAWGGGVVPCFIVQAQTQPLWYQAPQPGEIWTPYRVGIGTDSPNANLHVVGVSYFDNMVSPWVTVTRLLNVGYINIKASKAHPDYYDTISFFKSLIFYPENTPVAATNFKLIRFESPEVQFGLPGSSTYKVFVYGTLNTKNLNAQSIRTKTIVSDEYRLTGLGTVISSSVSGGRCSSNAVKIGGGICNDVIMFPEEVKKGNGRVGIGTSSPVRKLHIMTNEKATGEICCRDLPGDILFRQS